ESAHEISEPGGYVSARAPVKRTWSRGVRRPLPPGLAPRPGVDEEGAVAKDNRPRLRAPPLANPFRIVLVEPEIPQNTGNIARLAAATRSPLHLVGRLGFRIDEKAVRRAGLDYWHLVEVRQHLDLAHFVHEHAGARLRLFSAVAEQSYLDASFRP